MRIAAAYDNGNVFQYFGHTEMFKVYDVEDGEILNEIFLGTAGAGHDELPVLLAAVGIDTLICGGICERLQAAMSDANIRLFGGIKGNADEAVSALLAGTLIGGEDVHCECHEHCGDDCGHDHDHNHHHDHDCGCSCGQ